MLIYNRASFNLIFIIYVISPNLWKYSPSIPCYKMLFKILPHCLNPPQSQTWYELNHCLPHCAHSIMYCYASKHSEHWMFEMLLYNTYNIIGTQTWSNKCLLIWLLSWWVFRYKNPAENFKLDEYPENSCQWTKGGIDCTYSKTDYIIFK